MKKFLIAIGFLITLGCVAQYVTTAGAAPYPPALGGTGTSIIPASGTIPIGNGAGSYTPAFLTPGTAITITNASGSVTIAVQGNQFLPSSTVYVTTVNGQSGAVTITSSTLGVATNTISLFNGNGFTTTTIQSVLNALSATGLASYNSSTGVFSVSSSSLSLGSASHYNFSDFLQSSTVYVSSVNGSSGAVTITSSSLGVAPTAIQGMQCPSFTFALNGTSSPSSITTSSCELFFNLLSYSSGTDISVGSKGVISFVNPGFLSAAVTSIDTATATAHYFAPGAGIGITETSTASTATTTITNTGVTSFTGQGCVTAANSTGTVSLSVTCISGNQTITFTMAGDATGTASGATTITDSITVTGLNGKALPANTTGTLQFVGNAWKINLATSSLGQYDASGNLSSYLGSSCAGGQYVSSLSAAGAVTCSTPPASATTTINGTQAATFNILGDGTTVTSTVSGATTTFQIINTGNWAGTWQGVNSSTFYLASNPNGYITSTPPGVATTTINGVLGPTFTFTIVSTSSPSTISTSSSQVFLKLLKYTSSSDITVTNTGTILFASHNISQFTNDSGYLTSSTGVGSINTATGTVTITSANTATVSTTVSTSGGTITVSSTIPQSVATTASPTFAGLTASGNVTSTSFTATSTANSQIAVLNKNVNIPDQAYLNANGCPGFPTSTLVETCANAWYQKNLTIASSTNFYLAQSAYLIPATDTIGFLFNNAKERASIYCVPGNGTQIIDSAATGTLGVIQWGTDSQGTGATIQGCSWYGANTVNTNVSTTGNIGWLLNSPYITFRDNFFSQGSVQVYLGTNTYLNKFENNYFGFAGGYEVYAPNSANAGESNTMSNNTFATLGNATTTHCVYLNTESTNISGGSFDGCALEVGGLAHVSMSAVHHETLNANTTYGAYSPVQVDAGGSLTEVNGDYQNDGTGASSSPAFINNAGQVSETGPVLWANPSSTPNFITGSGSSTVTGADITHSAGTTNPNSVANQVANANFLVSTGTITGYVNSYLNMQYGTVHITIGHDTTDIITFGKAWNNPPICTMTGASTSAATVIVRSQQISNTQDIFQDSTPFVTSTAVNFICIGNPN